MIKLREEMNTEKKSKRKKETVALGQYVVSGTLCPAIPNQETLNIRKQSSGPEGDKVL